MQTAKQREEVHAAVLRNVFVGKTSAALRCCKSLGEWRELDQALSALTPEESKRWAERLDRASRQLAHVAEILREE